MAKYFVHQGMEFTTIEIEPSKVGSTGSINLQAVDLISVAKVLGTDIISGANDPALKTTLTAVWNTAKSNEIQELNRDILNRTAPLNAEAMPGDGADENRAATINILSAQYILPPGFADVLFELPDYDATDPVPTTTIDTRRRRAIVKSLEIRHDRFIKFEELSDAWQAWRRYVEATDFNADQQAAIRGYLIS